MNRDKHGSMCEILTEHLADLAKANPQHNQMEGHLREKFGIPKQITISGYFLGNLPIYLFFISCLVLARQLLCSNFETQNERAVEMFISSSVLTVSQSIRKYSITPRSTQCSCEEVKVHIKEQITFLNQSNDFIHTGHVCYGVSHQSPALTRTQTLTMKNTFLRGNSGFLFFFFLFW